MVRSCAGELDQRVAGALGLEVVAGLGERQPGRLGELRDHPRRRSPAGVLMPVPTAVPPSGSSRDPGQRRLEPLDAVAASSAAYPPNSWPSITGVASIRWVRPDFTTSANSLGLAPPAPCARWSSAGSRSSTTASVAATWIDGREGVVAGLAGVDVVVGVDVDAGARRRGWRAPRSCSCWRRCRSRSGRRRSGTGRRARRATISAGGGLGSPRPARRRSTPSSALTVAAAALTRASAWMCSRLEGRAADREVLDRALGLRPPQGVARAPGPRPCESCSMR